MQRRRIGPYCVSALGFGCMNLSHAYGTPPSPEEAKRVLLKALELDIDFFDTAALYGFGANEKLVGEVLKPYRAKIMLASKCGATGVDGKRVIDGRPETLKRTCAARCIAAIHPSVHRQPVSLSGRIPHSSCYRSSAL